VRAISKKESDDMLEPWLGSGLDLSDLPIPRLIVAKIDNQKNLNITQLQSDLSAILPNASLDDHARWNDRLKIMSRTMVLIALIIFALVMAAMILAVSFVTHGTMAENSEVINVLHFVGAENIYIAKEFQSHFLILGLRGGIVGGLLSAGAFFMLDRSFLLWAHGPEGDQLIALLGQPSLPIGGYFAIACVAVLAGLLTAIVSRLIVMRHLNNLW
jgi:cell division transport system permease protein